MISSRNMKHLMEVKEKLGNKYGADLIDYCVADVVNEKSIEKLQRTTKISSLMNKLALLFYKRKRDFIGRSVFSMVLHFLLA